MRPTPDLESSAAASFGDRPRAVFYSHDGFGLGHLQRNFNLAGALVRALPGASALLIGSSPHGFDSRLPSGVDWLKLPSVLKREATWEARTLRIGRQRLAALRAAIILTAVEEFRPHLLVVDHLPVGVWGELLPTLERCSQWTPPPRIVLGLRDVLDRPETTDRQWMRDGAYQALERYYDRILIYGDPRIVPTAELYGLARRMAPKIRYCGYVGPSLRASAARRVRIELGIRPHERLVVATAGGGRDGLPLLRAAARALAKLAGRAVRGLVLAGPLMPERDLRALRRSVEGTDVAVWWQTEDPPSLLAAADLVVGMGGYNTLVESLLLGRRLLVLPRSGPSAEQSLRAAAFSKLGLLTLLTPRQLSAGRLAARIEQQLDAPLPGPLRPRMGGRVVALRELLAELALTTAELPLKGRAVQQPKPSSA